ncbi:hypothetical protein GGR54DRAFT_314660 [Hypoxylon sp. NC1633]|nr:hypothetical protein GGR54DRAFT_314660 [Hypoxylon sp. NC1633]
MTPCQSVLGSLRRSLAIQQNRLLHTRNLNELSRLWVRHVFVQVLRLHRRRRKEHQRAASCHNSRYTTTELKDKNRRDDMSTTRSTTSGHNFNTISRLQVKYPTVRVGEMYAGRQGQIEPISVFPLASHWYTNPCHIHRAHISNAAPRVRGVPATSQPIVKTEFQSLGVPESRHISVRPSESLRYVGTSYMLVVLIVSIPTST